MLHSGWGISSTQCALKNADSQETNNNAIEGSGVDGVPEEQNNDRVHLRVVN